jgi:hypothetical protein
LGEYSNCFIGGRVRVGSQAVLPGRTTSLIAYNGMDPYNMILQEYAFNMLS